MTLVVVDEVAYVVDNEDIGFALNVVFSEIFKDNLKRINVFRVSSKGLGEADAKELFEALSDKRVDYIGKISSVVEEG